MSTSRRGSAVELRPTQTSAMVSPWVQTRVAAFQRLGRCGQAPKKTPRDPPHSELDPWKPFSLCMGRGDVP